MTKPTPPPDAPLRPTVVRGWLFLCLHVRRVRVTVVYNAGKYVLVWGLRFVRHDGRRLGLGLYLGRFSWVLVWTIAPPIRVADEIAAREHGAWAPWRDL